MTNSNRGAVKQGCLIFLGITIFVIGISCYWAYNSFKKRIITDPQTVEEKAKEIMDYTIPGGSQGLVSVDLGVVRLGILSNRGSQPEIMLMFFVTSDWSDADDPNRFERELDKYTRSFLSDADDIIIEKMHSEDAYLSGNKVTKIIKEGFSIRKDGSKKPLTMWSASIVQNKKGTIVAIMGLGENRYVNISAVFDSLKLKD